MLYKPFFFSTEYNTYFTLSEDWDLISINEVNFSEDNIIVLNGSPVEIQKFTHIFDISFFEFIISSLHKQEEFSQELKDIEQLKRFYPQIEGDFSFLKEYFLLLLKLTYSSKLISLLERYKTYYDTVIKSILFNIQHFNTQKFYINSDKLITLQNAESLIDSLTLEFETDKTAISIDIEAYNWAITGRINSKLFSQIPSIKNILEPKNDYILEIDVQAAEWNFLLFLTLENDKYFFNKKTYWSDLKTLLECSELSEDAFKTLLYSYVYGSSKESIFKHNIAENIYETFVKTFREKFPLTEKFIHFKINNKFISKDSTLIYDFFGKEIFVDQSYKKINYLLQSSFSSFFQMFISNVIKKMKELNLSSSVLLTIHDSVFIDIIEQEKEQIFSIIKDLNKNPQLQFRIKNLIRSSILNDISITS